MGRYIAKRHKHALTVADHCIETLRRNIMCKADGSIDTFVWTDTKPHKMSMKYTGMRTCVDWGKLESWALTRKVDSHPYIIRPGEDEDI